MDETHFHNFCWYKNHLNVMIYRDLCQCLMVICIYIFHVMERNAKN